jgi:adenine-specific DNA methylase
MVKSISNNIPIEFISKVSKKEANSRKPIYQIHKWFGRKTDAIFRSVLLSLELDEDKINDFQNTYYANNQEILKGKIVLDPFMGGGVTLVNTLRLGGKAIGIDINPVAWFITKNELQIPTIDKGILEEEIIKKLKIEFAKIENSVGNEIKEAYTTTIYDHSENKSKKVDIMYVLWVKKVRCPKCGKYIKLFPTYVITKLKRKEFENYNICPKCEALVKGNDKILICKKCNYKFDKDVGVYKGRNFICKDCDIKWNLMKDIIIKQEEPLASEIYAIQYYDPNTGKKGFKIPDEEDLNRYKNIKIKLKNLNDLLIDKFIPNEKIPEGYNTRQIKNHNYNYWKQMFNERQLYYLARLLEEINKIDDEEIKELFLCVFSNTINANNMFCIYNSQCGKIEPLFGDHHMAPVMNPVENNIWGTKLGRGSFVKYFKSFLQSKEFNIYPYERKNIDGKSSNIILKDEKFYSEFADSFQDLLSSDKNTMLRCSSAEDLSFLPSNSIDAVITDPPYYAAINYSEISEFFYVWDRLILKNRYDFFKSEHVLFDNEVTVNNVRGITKQEFQSKLTKCFSEIRRVLKAEAPLVLTYNNSTPEGWLVLLEALIDSGFTIEKAYPIHTELRAGLIDNRRDKMNYDLIIVAKEKNTEISRKIDIGSFMKVVNVEFQNICIELNDENLAFLDKLLIKVGKVFEIYSRYYPNIYKENSIVSAKDILEFIYDKSFH